MSPNLNAYGLLHVDLDHNRQVNIAGRQNSIDIYLLCSAICNRSLHEFGIPFKLITNNRQLLLERCRRLNIFDLEIIPREFVLPVPKGIPFFSAHFKLELYKEFASGRYGDYVALIDVDTIMLRQLPLSDDLAAYDISDQVFPRYGRDIVLRDLQILSGKPLANGRWYGGEFVMGSTQQFAELASLVRFCWPRYVQNLSTMHHLGDEMVLSAALNLYSEGKALSDYGARGNIVRWWSSRTFNEQAPFSNAKTTALLHLPADKLFMARFGPDKLTTTRDLLEAYQRHVHRKLLMRSILPTLNLLGSRPRKFMPRLS